MNQTAVCDFADFFICTESTQCMLYVWWKCDASVDCRWNEYVEIHFPFIHCLDLVVLAVDCAVSGSVTQFWVELEVGCLYHALSWAPELCYKCGSLGTQHSADMALASRNHACRNALRLERGCGTLNQLRQYHQVRCPRTILEHWRSGSCCAVTA